MDTATPIAVPVTDVTASLASSPSDRVSETEPLDAVCVDIDRLVDHAVQHLGLDRRDVDWTRNRILASLDLSSYKPSGATSAGRGVDELVASLRADAVAAGLFGHDDGTSVADEVMGTLSAAPSAISDRFTQIESSGIAPGESSQVDQAATSGGIRAMHWLYDYCVDNTYVRKSMLDRNPRFESHGLIVTINLAKPEFRNMKKATAGNAVAGGYPACTICHENEGFAGRDKRTLRTVPVTLGGQDWFWQFSPYGYFREHGICVNMRHTPMHVDRDTFVHLLDFVDRFPGYFLGCNAALPRIGGSVLAHDHYQGGGEILPMLKAPAWTSLESSSHGDALVEILDWPGTAMRVVSRSRDEIIAVSDLIRRAWIDYDDAQDDIVSHDKDGNRQSALSPSVIRTARGYEMNLILRNNAVSDKYPEGIFHAHPQFWPVKQEPIGLIEAQGLFILPGRLTGQLSLIEDALAAGDALPDEVGEFTLICNEIRDALNGSRDRDDIRAAVRDELGSVCERILGNTAVFKRKERTLAFLEEIGLRRS